MFPGRLGYDYALAIRMIQNGESTNWWTGIYFWFLRLTTFYGQSIYITSLIGLVSITYALWYFLSSVVENRKILERSFLITLCFPIVGVFGVTVSHDIFQSAGLLILSGLIWRFFQNPVNSRQIVSHYLLASLFLITTQTGIYTVAVTALLSLFTVYRKQAVASFILILLLSLVGNFGISGSVINVAQVPQEIKTSDGINYNFLIQIKLDSNFTTNHRKTIKPLHGFSGVASIVLDDKSLLEKLFLDKLKSILIYQ
jgi:hypothetical protein